jgi:hypothetical protein
LLWAVITVSLMTIGAAWAADSLHVRHDHDPWGSCEGEFTVADSGIQYHSEEKPEHDRDWTWLDIQTVDRISPDQFTILTYKDQKWLLGRDRPWNFTVLDPASKGLSDDLFRIIMTHLERPVVNREAREIDVLYEIPVKHLHTFGGCEGTLRFGKDWIVYATDHQEDQRSWRRKVEIANVWSTGRYDLEIEVYENEGDDLLRTRSFRFELKRPLDQNFFDQLRRDMLPPR